MALVICVMPVTLAQKNSDDKGKPVTIKGKVINKENEPVAGAVLYVDNLATTTVTKKDGSYKIKVSPSAMTLEVRSDAYGISKTAIKGQTSIDFTLTGGQAGATSSADQKNVSGNQDAGKQQRSKHKVVSYSNIYQMIRAEVPGVVVSGSSIQIHQGHSFFGSSTPLFVVNGVIVSSIDNVNPKEVKSIRVLTGSEASIYGVQGSNGVLSITLKNGSELDKEQ